MAKYCVVLLGGLLIVCGFVSAWQGIDIVQVERGWTQVIAGVTAVAGGVVTVAIGLLIGAVDRLRAAIGERRSSASRTGRREVPEPVFEPPVAVAVDAVAPIPSAAAVVAANIAPDIPGDPQVEPSPPAIGPVATKLPSDEIATANSPPGKSDNALADAVARDPALDWLRSAPRTMAELLKSGRDNARLVREPAARATLDYDKKYPGELRRYEANGVQYTLYTDGSIESNSTEGLKRFANMDELKAYLSRNEPRRNATSKSAPSP